MAAARHDPEVLADFQGGERCLVWARHKTDGTLHHLADGEARSLRSWTKEHLECLMPDCADRRLTTVARHPRRRDGFSHYAGAGGHSAESEAHQQGKAALVTWMRQTLGGRGVLAAAERSTSDRSRIADVMVTWPDGRKVALEVQYAPLSVHHWRERHESYRQQGITAVWLLGHVGTHLRAARRYAWESEEDAAGLVALSDLVRAMAGAGVPALWINPVLGQGPTIGTAAALAPVDDGDGRLYGDGHDGQIFEVPPRPTDSRAALATDLLGACTLDPTGLSTPALDRLRAAERELASINAARRATDAARAAADAEALAAATRDLERRRLRTQQRRDRHRAAWDASPLRHRLLEHHGGQLPYLLRVELGSEDGLYAPAEQWRAAVYRHLVHRRIGSSFTVGDAYRAIRRDDVDLAVKGAPHGLARAVIDWLDYLDRTGLVVVRRSRFEMWRVDRVDVRGDLEHPPPPQAATTVRTAVSPAVQSRTAAALDRSPPLPAAAVGAAGPGPLGGHAPSQPSPSGDDGRTGLVPLLSSTAQADVPRCMRCRRPLHPSLVRTGGLHISC